MRRVQAGIRPTPPVLLTVWRRPEATRFVLDGIRRARPAQLFVASDGPREDEHEQLLVEATRQVVARAVDWDCEVATLHRDENLGCRLAMSGAIDWFFDNVPEGIILEDDCVPHADFFPYCAELLERYRHDDRVVHITGDNSIALTWEGGDSYKFVRWPLVWGWASWRRSWIHYDRDLEAWTAATRGWRARRVLPDPIDREVWLPLLARLRDTGEPDTWDYQWTATVLRRGGLSIVPRVNLVTNMGFGPHATHTFDQDSPRAHRPAAEILPLRHPSVARLDRDVDRQLLEGFAGRAKAAKRVAERRSVRGLARRVLRPVRTILSRLRRTRAADPREFDPTP